MRPAGRPVVLQDKGESGYNTILRDFRACRRQAVRCFPDSSRIGPPCRGFAMARSDAAGETGTACCAPTARVGMSEGVAEAGRTGTMPRGDNREGRT